MLSIILAFLIQYLLLVEHKSAQSVSSLYTQNIMICLGLQSD